MDKFILNITASSGEFYQGDCESLTLPTSDGVYGVQAGHNPVLVAIQMGILHFEVNGEARDILVGDGIAEVTPAYVMVQVLDLVLQVLLYGCLVVVSVVVYLAIVLVLLELLR